MPTNTGTDAWAIIGARLRAAREGRGASPAETGAASGVGELALRNIEAGRRVDLDRVQRLARHHGLTLADLLPPPQGAAVSAVPTPHSGDPWDEPHGAAPRASSSDE